MTLLEARPGVRRLRPTPLGAAELLALKASTGVAVCIPARDEMATIGPVVAVAERLRRLGLVDEVVVVDDGSSDGTANRAAEAGARVLAAAPGGPGKGQALTRAVEGTSSELLVFLDADVTNVSPDYVTGLTEPLLADQAVQLAKATYRRSLGGRPGEGGRVTELLARPLLDRFFPELATVSQPLAGECAVRRRTVEDLVLSDGYGVEIGLLIDVHRRHGLDAIVEVDLGERAHRNRPLRQLRPHAADVLDAVLARVDP